MKKENKSRMKCYMWITWRMIDVGVSGEEKERKLKVKQVDLKW